MQTANATNGFDTDQEYRAIETALIDNARGRWFLAEHGRRSRRLDSVMLEESLGRLQSSLREPPAVINRILGETQMLATEIATAREALLARQAVPAGVAGGERPVQLMLKAAEELHELMWQLQGHDVDAVACERIGRQAVLIQALGSAQAAESERALALAAALDRLAGRLDGILATLAEETRPDEPLPPMPEYEPATPPANSAAFAPASAAPRQSYNPAQTGRLAHEILLEN